MPFIVTGRMAQDRARIGCATAVRALEKAAELELGGYADVLIADARGARYTPDEFTRFFCM